MARLKLLKLNIKEIKIKENGRAGPADAENLVMVNLIWPRPKIAQRTAVKVLRLEDNKSVNFSKGSYNSKVLFKESVLGKFGLSVEVTERKSPTTIQKFLASAIGSLITAGWPMPNTKEIGRRIIRAGTLNAFQSVDAKEKVQAIGFGEADLDPAKPRKGKIKIPLTAAADIKNNRGSAKKRKTLLKAGSDNGYIILSYEVSAS